MTSTTAPPAQRPSSNMQRASAPSIDEPGLSDLALQVLGEQAVENALDLVLPLPVTVALDVFDQVGGTGKALSVLRADTTAASLQMNETAATELKGKVQLLDGAAYAQVSSAVAVSKKPDGYEVATSVAADAGVSLTSKKQREADGKTGAEGEAGVVMGVTVTHRVKTTAEADGMVRDFKENALTNMALSQLPSGPQSEHEAASGFLGVYDAQRDSYPGAASVKTTIGGKAEVEALLWKQEHESAPVAAELGLKVETEQTMTMEVRDEDGAKSVTFSTSMKVAGELKGGAASAPHEELEGSFTGLGVAGEATVTRSKTYPLPKDFNARDASNVMKVMNAAQGEGKDEVSVEVKTQVGKHQHVTGKLTVHGDLRDALTVAGAALGKGDAKGILVEGEVTRSRETPSKGGVGVGVLSVEAELNRSQELQTVRVNDTGSFAKELGKKAFAGALDSSALLVNAR